MSKGGRKKRERLEKLTIYLCDVLGDEMCTVAADPGDTERNGYSGISNATAGLTNFEKKEVLQLMRSSGIKGDPETTGKIRRRQREPSAKRKNTKPQEDSLATREGCLRANDKVPE